MNDSIPADPNLPTCTTNVPDCAPKDETPTGTKPHQFDLPQGQHVEMESASIYSMGYNLAGRLPDFDASVTVINQQLSNSTESDNAEGSVRPVGRDLRWVHVQNAVDYHDKSMSGNKALIENFRMGMDRLSRLTRIIVNEVGGIDAQNKMTLPELQEKTGLPREAEKVDYRYSPGSPNYGNNTGYSPAQGPHS